MRRLAAIEYVSLDGVVQAPGHAGEDPDGGFEHGGWTGPFMAEHRRYISESFQTVDAFLLGRITYELFAAVWPAITDETDQIARALNTRPKYVASTTLTDPAWQGTRLLSADVARDVTELKAQPGHRIALIGSSQLAHLLIRHDLIDEYELYVHQSCSAAASDCSPKTVPHQTCGSSTAQPPAVDSSSSATNACTLIRRLDPSTGAPSPVIGQLPVAEHLKRNPANPRPRDRI
jgi:dihydrofolate reductase